MSAIHQSAEWMALARRMRPVFREQIENGTALCIDCGRPIYPEQKWAVGHVISASDAPELALMDWNLGPTHHGKGPRKNCNQSAGGSMGAKKTNARRVRKQGEEYPKWY